MKSDLDLRKIQTAGNVVRRVTRYHIEELGYDVASSRDLAGGCGYASYALAKILPLSTLVYGEYLLLGRHMGHCWVEHNDYIIDVTRTQFGRSYNAVSILPADHSNYLPIFRGRKAETEILGWYDIQDWKTLLVRDVKQELKNSRSKYVGRSIQ